MHIRTWSACERLKKQHQAMLCLYVDGILVKGSNECELVKFKESMENEFKMPDLVNFAYFLGLQTVKAKHGVFLDWKRYAEDILKNLKMRNCKPTITTMETNIKLKGSWNEVVDNTLYKRIIGSLRCLYNTWSYICHNVGLVSRLME